MTPDPYRVAYESALEETAEIAAKFEQLRVRKRQIEDLIAALQPIFAAEFGADSPSPVSTQHAAPEGRSSPELVGAMETSDAVEQASYSYLDVPNPLPQGDGNPFQRRVKASFRFRGLAAQRSY